MRLTFTILSFLLFTTTYAQVVADFENFNLAPGEALNGSDGNGGFSSGNIFLNNSYNPDFASWTDWAISTKTDTVTAGFTNDLSVVTGSGANATNTFAVSAAFAPTKLKLTGSSLGQPVDGMYITNNTYAALSMRDGDAFAKKFGGETGDDPDFFLLTIQKYYQGELGTETVNFFLADFRSEDNDRDYIVNEWVYVDLTSLGNVDSLQFTLSSSDNGQFGMNTPAYFCIDEVTTSSAGTTSLKEVYTKSFETYPNPVADYLTINWTDTKEAIAGIYGIDGRAIRRQKLSLGTNQLSVQNLVPGLYTLRIEDQIGWQPRLIIVK